MRGGVGGAVREVKHARPTLCLDASSPHMALELVLAQSEGYDVTSGQTRTVWVLARVHAQASGVVRFPRCPGFPGARFLGPFVSVGSCDTND